MRGRRAEVAVDLKRRVRVEEVVERLAGEEIGQEAVRVVAVEEARPEVDLPRQAPTRSLVAAGLERLARGFSEGGRRERADLRRRVQPVEMRGVAMVRFDLLVVLYPFHDASGRGADPHGRQALQRGLALGAERGLLDSQDLRRSHAVLEQVVHDLEVHGRAVGEHGLRDAVGQVEAVLGRMRWVGHQVPGHRRAGGRFDEEVEHEARGAFHQRPRTRPQELPVAREQDSAPTDGGRATRRPPARRPTRRRPVP